MVFSGYFSYSEVRAMTWDQVEEANAALDMHEEALAAERARIAEEMQQRPPRLPAVKVKR
ncbi:MAG: hypothetical protein BAA04_01460 [Firmicutes bacterium ZCTH02-B6]|nr:MAG: hypothetical protein BAA04_01460 [Firmicutes bacterium ZCTH02-B6]